MKTSIAIIGGGIMGSAAAYFLARSGQAGSITVIEPDPTYAAATTPQGAGGIRQQFSLPENIAMSGFSLDFYKSFARQVSDIPDVPDTNFREQGYLLVVTENGEKILRHNQQLQSAMGARAELVDYAEIRRRFPSIQRNDIVLGCHTPDDGWIDPSAALWGFRRAATHLGVTHERAGVTAINTTDTAVTSARLDTGEVVEADFFINTAGPWAASVAGMTGAHLPVVPMCRVQHFWKCSRELEPLPLVTKTKAACSFALKGPVLPVDVPVLI